MLILGFDTSVAACSVALCRDTAVLGAEPGVAILNDVVLNQVLVRFGDDDAGRLLQEFEREADELAAGADHGKGLEALRREELRGHEDGGPVGDGDRVAARGSHPAGYCGFDFPGAFAEYVCVPESMMATLPDNVSDSEGAVIQVLTDSVAGVNRWNKVIEKAGITIARESKEAR